MFDEKLAELVDRIRVNTSKPDERPAWIHWSDAELLANIGLYLSALQAANTRLHKALGRALHINFPQG